MLDTFFQSGQKYAYDACNTLRRAASMLLMRGINIRESNHPCTDGSSTIYLPSAMKRWLSWDEIDFVRYLLHHEAAHIKFSPSVEKNHSSVYHTILNALEDIRIEAKDKKSLAGSSSIYSIGHKISLEMWDKALEAKLSNGQDLTPEHALVDCIFVGSIDKKRRGKFKSTMSSHIDALFEQECVYTEIDKIDDNTKFEFVKWLTQRIESPYRAAIQDNKTDPDNCGMPQEVTEKIEEGCCTDQENNAFGSGLPELCSSSVCVEDGSTEEKIDFEEIRKNGHASGFNIASDSNSNEVHKTEANQNYEWGRFACAQASELVNRLRGQSRAKWSKPKDSGIRLAQSAVPRFIQGLTPDILRRRTVSQYRGTSVFLMVDDSSSMRGSFDTPAWRAAALLGHACSRAQFRLMIARFSNGVGIEKYWHTPMQSMRNRLAFCFGGGTNGVEALDTSYSYLKMERTSRRVLFFITDGACGSTRPTAQTIIEDGIELYPVLLGAATRFSARGGNWDLPTTINVVNPRASLASDMLTRLAAVID